MIKTISPKMIQWSKSLAKLRKLRPQNHEARWAARSAHHQIQAVDCWKFHSVSCCLLSMFSTFSILKTSLNEFLEISLSIVAFCWKLINSKACSAVYHSRALWRSSWWASIESLWDSDDDIISGGMLAQSLQFMPTLWANYQPKALHCSYEPAVKLELGFGDVPNRIVSWASTAPLWHWESVFGLSGKDFFCPTLPGDKGI